MKEKLGENLIFQKKHDKYKEQLAWLKEHYNPFDGNDVTYGTSQFHEYWIEIVKPLKKDHVEESPFIVCRSFDTLVHIDCDEKKITVKDERYYALMVQFGKKFESKELTTDW